MSQTKNVSPYIHIEGGPNLLAREEREMFLHSNLFSM